MADDGGGINQVLGLAVAAGGGYILYHLWRSGAIQLPSGLLPGSKTGRILRTGYAPTNPGPCGQVAASVQVQNPTGVQRTYVLYGYETGPDGDVTRATGHLWPNEAAGVQPGMPYHGLEVMVPAFQTVEVHAWTYKLATPNPITVVWQLWEAGGTTPVDTKTDPNVIQPNIRPGQQVRC